MLGIGLGEAISEVESARGPSLRLSFLEKLVPRLVASQQHTEAARAYILYVLGCTLFADKTWTSVCIAHLGALVDIEHLTAYAWGTMAFANLYDHLTTASHHSLLQVLRCFNKLVLINTLITVV
jgi:hypothetical protein